MTSQEGAGGGGSSSSFVPPLNHIPLDTLAKTHIAKQLVYKGVATILTHAAHAAAPEYFWKVCDEHFTFQPFINYLRPQQLIIEAARLGWDYLLFKVLAPGRLESGNHVSPAHLAIFSDSWSQIVFPKVVRPALMYIPLTNAQILATTMNMSQGESRTIAVLQSLRWWGQSLIAAVERKLNNRTPRSWKTLIFCSAVDGIFQLGSYTFCNWIFFKFPQSWRSTAPRHIALSMSTICVGFALNAGLVNLLNVTAFLPIFRKLQGYTDPQLPPVGPVSQYHEYNAMSMLEFRLLLEHLNYMVVQESTGHRDRVALLMKIEKMMIYDQAIRDPKTCNVMSRPPSQFPLNTVPYTIAADDLRPRINPADGELTDGWTKCSVLGCGKEWELGDQVFMFDPSRGGCGYYICGGCASGENFKKKDSIKSKMKYTEHPDFCFASGFSVEKVTDEDFQKLRQRHDDRMNKMFRTWGSGNKAVIPSDVLYSQWLDVAHVAISRKLISRYTASVIEWDLEYKRVNNYSEWILWIAVTLLDISPTQENPCCQIPFL